jgi:hypothetical protein
VRLLLYQSRWRLAAWLILGAVIGLAAYLNRIDPQRLPPGVQNALSFSSVHIFFHFMIFAVVGYLLAAWPPHAPPKRRMLWALAAVVIGGLGIEVAQLLSSATPYGFSPTERLDTALDLSIDLLGGAAGIGWAGRGRRG